MKIIITQIVMSLIFFIILPLNIVTMAEPPYWNFWFIGISIFIFMWAIPNIYFYKKLSITWKILGILVSLTMIWTVLFYYYVEQESVINLRKERWRKVLEEITKNEKELYGTWIRK